MWSFRTLISLSLSPHFVFFPGLVKLSDLKGGAVMGKSSRAVTVPDSLMTQREETLEQQPEDSAEPAGAEDSESKALRRRTKKSGTGAAEERVKGRRQRDFDPTAVDDDSEDEKKPSASKEKPSAAEDLWTQNQQKLLELALQQYPRGTTERWDKIAKVVPGKTKVSIKLITCSHLNWHIKAGFSYQLMIFFFLTFLGGVHVPF